MNRNIFNSIQMKKPGRNHFDLTHDVKMSCKFGNLYPILAQECVPGDSFNIGCESLIRMAPMIAPVMQRMNVTMHYFFVPNRIVWDGWEKWIVQDNDPAPRVFPVISFDQDSYDAAPILDYFGVPRPASAAGITSTNMSALALAAYQCVYNEFYRDQNLIDPVNYKLVDGNNNLNTQLLMLRKRAWSHDYFTSSLPFSQKGAAVDIPLGDIRLKDDWAAQSVAANKFPRFTDQTGSLASGEVYNDSINNDIKVPNTGVYANAYDPGVTLETQATTINDLRRAFRLQEWLERNARGGTRYVENILAHFGVKSSDQRMQRPEYITGVKSPLVVSEVLNTTGEDGGLPQGNMAGHGMGVVSGKYGRYFCEEHGYIIGIMSILPTPAYQQGLPRHFRKYDDPFQYFWPEFANIGEQEVLRSEIYLDGVVNDDDVFGYVPRYAEYKYAPSRVAGEFKTSLNYWHLGRIFDAPPTLSKEFIECDPAENNRIFAVTSPDVDTFYCHVLNKITALRPMPKFGTPMM